MFKGKTIVVGMSGGVDSSVTAAMLKAGGANVIGVHMNIWDPLDTRVSATRRTCYGPAKVEALQDAKNIAKQIDILFYEIDVTKEFASTVLDYFSDEYLAGRTPNPCVMCNRYIKFGALWDGLKKLGVHFDFFATGHYAKVALDEVSGRYVLLKGDDPLKEQSYFLHGLSQEQLSKTIFPLVNMQKTEVKQLAVDFGLDFSKKKESQNFVDGEYGYLLKEESPSGDFVDVDGNVLGKHRGLAFYTIGQRRGIGIAAKEALYVIRLDSTNNEVVVGVEEHLYSTQCRVNDVNFISIGSLLESMKVTAKARYASKDVSALIIPVSETSVDLIFDEPQKSLTPGQSAVFYNNNVVIGGGVIE